MAQKKKKTIVLWEHSAHCSQTKTNAIHLHPIYLDKLRLIVIYLNN